MKMSNEYKLNKYEGEKSSAEGRRNSCYNTLGYDIDLQRVSREFKEGIWEKNGEDYTDWREKYKLLFLIGINSYIMFL